ncbi:MAG: hypothetical protein DHS20C05_19570 [Hyphococcus sp.]|nr:MAG: hypothetical protein DHS20C05_19570 [Marinicaulis sp.]
MTGNDDHKSIGKGLSLPGLIVGLLTGAALYAIVEYWIDDKDTAPMAFSVLFFVATLAASYLLLAETNKLFKALFGAVAIAAFFILPDYFMASLAGDETKNLTAFPPIFWFGISRGLSAYLLITLVKASIEKSAPPPYHEVFFHGLTMPLIAAGAKIFAGLALVLLFVWARLLKEMDVNFFNKLFQEPWFILPFLGAIGGLSIAMMRGQQSVLSALRYILLLFCRIVMPITAVFTITFLMILMIKGTGAIFDKPYPGGIMIGLALAGMLIFNGVYQNGEGAPPPLWLRLATLITLIGFPVYTGLAFSAFTLRIEDYGLTPARIAGLAITGLVAAYSLVCFAGLVTELNWRAKRWMPMVAPLNTAMAAIWVLVLSALATPLFNPWAMSANSQYSLLAKQKIAAEDFDFGYLRFQLGEWGEDALDKLLGLTDHPEAGAISNGVARARDAKSQWEYANPDFYEALETLPDDTSESSAAESDDGPMGLELNPDGGPDEDNESSSAEE